MFSALKSFGNLFLIGISSRTSTTSQPPGPWQVLWPLRLNFSSELGVSEACPTQFMGPL